MLGINIRISFVFRIWQICRAVLSSCDLSVESTNHIGAIDLSNDFGAGRYCLSSAPGRLKLISCMVCHLTIIVALRFTFLFILTMRWSLAGLSLC